MKPGKTGFLCLLFFFLVLELPAQEYNAAEFARSPIRGEICFVWYNVENLFHPDDDSIPGDDEFTPRGLRYWTWSRYREKLTALAKVIIASGRGDPPELVALCEVENAQVLEDLCLHPILASYHYSYLHRDSPDHRGMDVACLLRWRRIDSVQWQTLPFISPVSETRDLMHLSLNWGGDTLDLFLVHLLSKYGGAGATAELRRSQFSQMVQLLDSVYAARDHALLMAAGDFNECYEAYPMEPLRKARFGGDSLKPQIPREGRASYKYKGQWTPIDQVLLLQDRQSLSLTVHSLGLSPLLCDDLSYGGIKPKRTYEGYKYSGGISDHLPLVMDLSPSPFLFPGRH